MIYCQLLFIDLIYYRPYSTVAMPATLNGMLRNRAFQVISAPYGARKILACVRLDQAWSSGWWFQVELQAAQ